ncbi:MAG: DNA mismatch repair endonuclease MutL [Acidobacteriota bacterium]|nr:DNA mismatch repair endonuclease MutL [Acidobacteriota bacterium]
MAKIHILSDRLASQIAAGEVVERPAAVVKELLENALDAGAGSVEIDLEAGGKRRIVVADDGGGMDRDDALLAFDRHATSKISDFDDLERVSSFGFRGEALASIAAVARVELTTAERAGEGVRVRIEGGRVRSVAPVSHPRGTRVEVAALFFNVPARRKFLKAPATELRHATAVVQAYALARPGVRLELRQEGRPLLEVAPAPAGEEGARLRIGQIFGPALADDLAVIPAAATPDGGRIWGFVGGPASARGRRRFAFVNGRMIRDRAVMAVFYRAVREEWRSEEFPALFLFLDLAPEAVDVNVHPQKAEVRFRDPLVLERAGAALRGGLRAALGEVEAGFGPAGRRPEVPFAWQGLGEREGGGRGPFDRGPSAVAEGARLAQAAYAPLERAPVRLAGRGGAERPFRLLGQYKGTMILLEGPDGLYIIDQHVAHERVLFERIARAMAAESSVTQKLLQPVILELSAAEALRIREHQEDLESCGFHLAVLSGNTIALSETPAGLGPEQAERLVARLAASPWEADDPATLRAALLAALAADASCKAAVKMHEPLSAAEMEALVAELFAAEQPFACPHGRPIVMRMTDGDLESRFGRR